MLIIKLRVGRLVMTLSFYPYYSFALALYSNDILTYIYHILEQYLQFHDKKQNVPYFKSGQNSFNTISYSITLNNDSKVTMTGIYYSISLS